MSASPFIRTINPVLGRHVLRPCGKPASLLPSYVTRALSHRSGSIIIERMPEGSWDSHMHVTSPDYPLASNAAYKPSLHSLDHAMAFEKTIGIRNIVLVQPSIYGDNNSCLLDALKEIGPAHGRGVVGVDPDNVNPKTLREWHEIGVRGVRVNLKSVNAQFTHESLRETLHKYAQMVKPLNWVIELFIGMEAIPMLLDIISDLDAKFCIAHFGAPDLDGVPFPPHLSVLPGYAELEKLLTNHKVWIKFSAAYRFERDARMLAIGMLARELLTKAGNRVVFASDWPHTRFEGVDVKPFVEACLEWSEERGLVDAVFRDNAKELWDVK